MRRARLSSRRLASVSLHARRFSGGSWEYARRAWAGLTRLDRAGWRLSAGRGATWVRWACYARWASQTCRAGCARADRDPDLGHVLPQLAHLLFEVRQPRFDVARRLPAGRPFLVAGLNVRVHGVLGQLIRDPAGAAHAAPFVARARLGTAGQRIAERFQLALERRRSVIAHNGQLDLIARVHVADDRDELIAVRHLLAVDARDPIARAEAHLLGRRARVHSRDDDALAIGTDANPEAAALRVVGVVALRGRPIAIARRTSRSIARGARLLSAGGVRLLITGRLSRRFADGRLRVIRRLQRARLVDRLRRGLRGLVGGFLLSRAGRIKLRTGRIELQAAGRARLSCRLSLVRLSTRLLVLRQREAGRRDREAARSGRQQASLRNLQHGRVSFSKRSESWATGQTLRLSAAGEMQTHGVETTVAGWLNATSRKEQKICRRGKRRSRVYSSRSAR
jgi:hypothetical protein